MGASSRQKGLAGEREVAALLTQAGFDVRNLDGRGDFIILTPDGRAIHGEAKRRERIKLREAVKQVEDECNDKMPWALFMRWNGSPWYVVQLADSWAKAIG